MKKIMKSLTLACAVGIISCGTITASTAETIVTTNPDGSTVTTTINPDGSIVKETVGPTIIVGQNDGIQTDPREVTFLPTPNHIADGVYTIGFDGYGIPVLWYPNGQGTNSPYTPLYNGTRFIDVLNNNMYIREINWLASTGITTGYSNATYRPLNKVERGAMAAFFYRMAGSPAYTPPKTSPFKDVPTTHQFYKEISWMASKGITTGYSDKTFRPDASVNRDAMAAFFYRFAGKPAYSAPSKSVFKDIKPGDQFYKEVSWLASRKISTGWSVAGGAEFRPVTAIRRDAMAAFIYRYNSNVAPVGKK